MKKLIPLFVVLAAGIASAEWKLNPYTQRQDYYEAAGNSITSLTGAVTASGPGAAAATIVSVPQAAVNLSTVTTALAGKLTAPATFYVVKTSDYLVAPATFTYQAPGNYITALTGNVTASGPGSATATIASLPAISGASLTSLTAANISAGTAGISITGNAATATALAADPADCSGVNFARGIAAGGAAACAQPSDVTGNSATATKLATARTINGVSFDGSANINIATTSYLADGVSLALTGATFSAKSSSVTLQGNTFNGASQLVKLAADGKLPAVDGSQLLNLPSTSGGAVLAATQTFTGANTFSGSITSSGNNNWTGSNSFSTPPTGLSNSISTILPAYTVSQTAFTNCVPGSTLTMTTSGGRVMVGFAGHALHSSSGQSVYATYKVDGVTATSPIVKVTYTAPNYEANMSFTALTNELSPGVHSFCLVLRNSGASNSTVSGDSKNQFWVQELR